ncbi:hypothetical protein [Mesorhizobium sp. IMUNJ 23232]|uniref:hypothetical protein n=1 Tax=Mesorhizobium sp. IMUNJ 23232 TaxID=3376064 RepID=UPI0037ABB5D3
MAETETVDVVPPICFSPPSTRMGHRPSFVEAPAFFWAKWPPPFLASAIVTEGEDPVGAS